MKPIKPFLVILALLITITASADKLSHLRTSKKIISVDVISPPYFTIQIAALQLPPENPSFFNNFDTVKEYICSDGFARYTVGDYNSFDDAAQNLAKIRSMGYADAFILDRQKLKLGKNQFSNPNYKSGSNSSKNSNSSSGKNFVPVPGQKYTIQLAAMRYPVYITHFEGFSDIKEYYMKSDRIYRYCTGTHDGSVALSELEKVKAKGYPDAHLVPIERYAQYLIE
jgi:hypothetical protein